MKTYHYKKYIAMWCILLGACPFLVTLIAYIVIDPWTVFDTHASIWIFAVFLFFICIALAVLAGRRIEWDNWILYHYRGDRLVWRVEIQSRQTYVRMLTAPKVGRFISLVYIEEDKAHKREIVGCDNLSDLYVELHKYNDPDMPKEYPKQFKLFNNFHEIQYEDVVESLKGKGNQA